MVAKTANDLFFDAMLRHQIYLLRLSSRIRNEIFAILDATEADIAEQIRRRLQNNQSVERQQALLKYIKGVRNDAWTISAEVWQAEIVALAAQEPIFTANAIRTVSPAVLDLIMPDPTTLRALVTSKPFEGEILKDWASEVARRDLKRIERGVRIGVAEGESSKEIARRVVGTVEQKGKDGLTEIARREAEAITRTAVNHVSNAARDEFFQENADIIERLRWTATLDARTTPVCRSRDGKLYPVNEGPRPPAHWNCRSLMVATLDGEVIGTRPMRNFTQKQLLREFATERGIAIPTTRAGLPRGYKTAFDKWARGRMREMTGTTPASTTYQEWLKGQSAQFQEDVLGKTRARLFRRGRLTLDKFVDKTGKELTLKELARTEAQAFRDAGLNPDDFL